MWRVLFMIMPGVATAESLVATHTIPAQSVVTQDDVTLVDAEIPNALVYFSQAIGKETRVAIYAGRPVLATDVGPPAMVDRNQIVQLSYKSGTLAIITEGRALARGGVGDVILVMNLASRNTVSGRITSNGTVVVGSFF